MIFLNISELLVFFIVMLHGFLAQVGIRWISLDTLSACDVDTATVQMNYNAGVNTYGKRMSDLFPDS